MLVLLSGSDIQMCVRIHGEDKEFIFLFFDPADWVNYLECNCVSLAVNILCATKFKIQKYLLPPTQSISVFYMYLRKKRRAIFVIL